MITLGSDPEVFVFSQGNVLPSWEFLPSKEEGDPYWDGWQAEFTTQPHHTVDTLVNDIRRGLLAVSGAARKLRADAILSHECLVEVDPTIPVEYKYIDFGCKPSKNIYAAIKPMYHDPRHTPFRTAGAHIHVGVEAPRKDVYRIIHTMDKCILLPMLIGLDGLENLKRRELYGRPGEFRWTSYGFEYRSLSSTILMHPLIVELVGELTKWVVGNYQFIFDDVRVIEATTNVELARQVVGGIDWSTFSQRELLRDFVKVGALGMGMSTCMEENWL